MSTNQTQEDYLDEDKPLRQQVKKQNWCVISMLTPNSFPESKREQYKDQKILGIKIRGVFEEYEEAQKRADTLQKLDKYHNIFVGEVGKWLPFDVDTTNMGSEDQVYREKSLNTYMKSYKDALQDEEQDEKSRKSDMLKGANVVTDKNRAPSSLGLGKAEGEDVDVKSKISVEDEEDEDTEITKNKKEQEQIKSELGSSKVNLETIEDKLSQINKIYSELKSNK